MNFKTKALVAAVALAAAGAANASIVNSAGGNSEFVFSAYANGVGYTYDLEDAGFDPAFGSNPALVSLIGTQFNSGAAVNGPVTLAAAPANGVVFDYLLTGFDSFMTQANAAAPGDVQWNLVAADGSGVRRIIQTVAEVPQAMVSDKAVVDSVTAFDLYTGAANSFGTMPNTTDGNAVTHTSDGAAYAGLFGNNFGGNTTLLSSNALDATADLYVLRSKFTGSNASNFGAFGALVDAAGNPVVARTYLDGSNAYHLQIAALAPVPEPSEYAMLLAGLGLLGMVARRRLK